MLVSVNKIGSDWGGKVFVDLMKGVADVRQSNPYLARNRADAAGASYVVT